MTVMDLQVQLAASGLDIPVLANADPKNYRPILEAQIKAWAASVGRRALRGPQGERIEYGEEFRRARFGGVERWGRDFGAELQEDI
jgi:hypothetical protein